MSEPQAPRRSGDADLAAMPGRYAARAALADRYSLLQSDVWQTVQERQRWWLRQLTRRAGQPETLRAVDVGCGQGQGLLELLRTGLRPDHLMGCELLDDRRNAARARLPEAVRLWGGDAADAPIDPSSQDLVLQSTVFSSLLDDDAQTRLAMAMWRWLRPGGAIVWYDFTVDNPRNTDVRGVPRSRLRALFPQGQIDAQRLTLAPPLARVVTRWHPSFYTLFNLLPPLRTHLAAWITKP